MSYADYLFYTEQYRGTMSDNDFKRLSIQASAYIDRATFNRIKPNILGGEHGEKIKLACCAVADAYLLIENGGGIIAETVGKYTRNYAAGVSNTPTEGRRLYTAASLYLGGTGLMYRGC